MREGQHSSSLGGLDKPGSKIEVTYAKVAQTARAVKARVNK